MAQVIGKWHNHNYITFLDIPDSKRRLSFIFNHFIKKKNKKTKCEATGSNNLTTEVEFVTYICQLYVTLCMFYRFIKLSFSLGNRAPVLIPNKLTYMISDLKLLSEYFGVPMFQPPNIHEKGIQAMFLYDGSHDQIYNAPCKPYLFSFSHKEKEWYAVSTVFFNCFMGKYFSMTLEDPTKARTVVLMLNFVQI